MSENGRFTGEYEVIAKAKVTQADRDLVAMANKALEEGWVTINGNHVLIGDEEDSGSSKADLAPFMVDGKKDRFGGLPDGGGYSNNSAYEALHQEYAEAAHCIVGAIGKDPSNASKESKHVYEELHKMEAVFTDNFDYGNGIYRERAKANIPKVSKALAETAADLKMRAASMTDPKVKQLMVDTSDSLVVFGTHARQYAHNDNYNVFKEPAVMTATRKIRMSADALYKIKEGWVTINGAHVLIGEEEENVKAIPEIETYFDSTGKYADGTSRAMIKAAGMVEPRESDKTADYEVATVIDDSYCNNPHSWQINRYLREGTLSDEMGKIDPEYSEYDKQRAIRAQDRLSNEIKWLDSAMDTYEQPLPVGLYAYRGVGDESGRYLSDLAMGDTFKDKGFQSFSIDDHHVQGFTEVWGKGQGKEQIAIVRAITTDGDKAVWHNTSEDELIFRRGTEWKVIGKEMVKVYRDTRYVDAHIITVMRA
jgi:hypothetical protein